MVDGKHLRFVYEGKVLVFEAAKRKKKKNRITRIKKLTIRQDVTVLPLPASVCGSRPREKKQ